MTAASLIRRVDMDFLLLDWLGADRLAELPRFSDLNRETLTALLDLSETVATRRFLPHYKQADVVEPRLEDGCVRILQSARRSRPMPRPACSARAFLMNTAACSCR